MAITDSSILHHLCIVLVLLWLLSSFNCCHPVAYFISLVYIYLVHERYVMRLRRKIRFEERRQSNQRRVLSESETVRWLNLAVEKIWPVCMEQIVSQKILLPIMPWFLQKFKPWTVKEAVVQELYMGRSPPILTEIRVIRDPTGDDHLVLELGMNFLTAEDMNAILAVKLTKRLGFGMWTKLHLLGLHVEGKVKVGVKFLPHWPFLGRLRVCFVEPPYFQMTVKPLFTHGVDVTELPGIAGWLDNLLGVAFEQTLVEPNMLVVDMEKFVSPQQETWFSVDEKKPVGYAVVEVIEGADMKPSDLNGLADPYVKGQLGPYRFRTKIQKKTLAPKWQEEFRVPICTWESPNVLDIAVHDKDIFNDDTLGDCSININNIRGSQRNEMWLPLRNIKMGRLHLAITVVEGNGKEPASPRDSDTVNDSDEKVPTESETAEQVPLPTSTGKLPKSPTEKDKYEPIKIEGHQQTGMWVHSPGSEISPVWEPRKGRNRLLDEKIQGQSSSRHDSFKSSVSNSNVVASTSSKSSVSNSNVVASTSSDESVEGSKDKHPNKVMRGMKKIRSIFHKSPKNEDSFRNDEDHPSPSPSPSLQPNLRAVNAKKAGGVKLIIEDNSGISPPSQMKVSKSEGTESNEGSERDSPRVRDKAKGMIKNAGKSAMKHVLSRKWSKKSREDDTASVGTEKDFTSDDESPPSQDLTSTGISVVSRPLAGGDNGSLKSGEDEVEKSATDLTVDVPGVYNVILEGDESKRDDVPSGKSPEHDGDDTTSGKSQEHDGDDTTTSQNKLSSDAMVTETTDSSLQKEQL